MQDALSAVAQGRRGMAYLGMAAVVLVAATVSSLLYARFQPITAREMVVLDTVVSQVAKDRAETKEHVWHMLAGQMAVRDVDELPRSRFDDALGFLAGQLNRASRL